MTDPRELPPSDFYAGMQLGLRLGFEQGRRDCLKKMRSKPVLPAAATFSTRLNEILDKQLAKSATRPTGKTGKRKKK